MLPLTRFRINHDVILFFTYTVPDMVLSQVESDTLNPTRLNLFEFFLLI